MSEQTQTHADPLRIGTWWLEASTHRLQRPGQEKRLTRLQVQLLLALAERPTQGWSRQQLIERVWPRRMVADEVLSRAIAQLRVLLEDDARNPSHIETVHGRGYRLLAEVSSAPMDAPASAPDPTAPASEGATPARRPGRKRWTAAALVVAACVLLSVSWWWRKAKPDESLVWPSRIAAAQSYMSTGGRLLQPRFSVDGERLLWIEPAHRRLQISDRAGSVLHQIELAPEQVGSASFSRDGQSVYALLQNEGCRVVEIPLRPRAEPVELSKCLHASLGLAVEADGSLLFTGPDSGLLRHRRDGSAEQVLSTPDCSACVDSQPRVAEADIVFLRGRGAQQAVWLLQPSGKSKPLSGGDDRITDLAFDARHRKLLAASNAYGSPALIEIDIATAHSRLLGARGAYGLDIAKDGALVLELRRVQSPLWLQAAGGSVQPLTQSLRDDSQPALSPDGRRVAFVSNRSGSGGVWLLDLESSQETALSLPPARAWTRPSWSPDGQRLWLSRYDDTGVQAVQIEVATARTQPLPRELLGQVAERVIEVEQGEWLQIAQRQGTRVLIHQHDSAATEVGNSHGIGSLARDGDWVVFDRVDDPQLWAWRLGAPAQPARPIRTRPSHAWSLHRGELWQYSPDQQGSILRTQLVDNGTRVWATHFGAAPRDLQAMSNGEALLFSRVHRVESELMLSVPSE